MATTIVLKNSVTTTNTPSSLAQGEVAINVTDKKVWVGNAATTPIQIVNGGPDGVFTSVTDSGLTINRLTYAGTGGLLKDSANIVTDGSKITTSTGFVGGPWTTATRPASPATGQEGFNTTIGAIEAYNGTSWVSGGITAPTVTVYTSGSGTFTTAANTKYLFVRLVGGGGGGGASITNSGTTGGNTTFGALTGSGGGAGATWAVGAAGGAASGGDVNIQGGGGASGGTGTSSASIGGQGGSSALGGGGAGTQPNSSGQPGATNSGGGGGGGNNSYPSGASGAASIGASGGAGGYVEKTYTSPAATYSYGVGAGGAGGAGDGGATKYAGGAGGSGIIIVTAFF